MGEAHNISRRRRSSLEMLLSEYVDGPERLVADAIVRGGESLRTIALEGGLVNNQFRQIAWPMLLSEDRGPDKENIEVRSGKHEQETFKQIHLDVPRSVPKESAEDFEKFLVDYFEEYTDLCFYQGFADVAWAVYRIATDGNNNADGVALARFVLDRLSRNTILRDAHRENFEAIYAYLPCVSAAIIYSDRDLAKAWENKDVSRNHWAIAPLVSLFTHGAMVETVVGQILDAIIALEQQVEFPLCLVSALPMLPSVRERLVQEPLDAVAIHEIMVAGMNGIHDAEELIVTATRLHSRLPSKFMLKTAMAAGAPSDSLLIVNGGGPQRANTYSMLRKRSWRTLAFFSEMTDLPRLPLF